MTRAERTEQMLAHVAAQEQSGTSRKTYCVQQGLNLCVLNYWFAKRKCLHPDPSGGEATAQRRGFAQVELSSGGNLELHYPNGVRLLLPANTALAQVAACIRLY